MLLINITVAKYFETKEHNSSKLYFFKEKSVVKNLRAAN
jgi:hypothetical protein